jgi:hypothetical protein
LTVKTFFFFRSFINFCFYFFPLAKSGKTGHLGVFCAVGRERNEGRPKKFHVVHHLPIIASCGRIAPTNNNSPAIFFQE